MKETLIKYIAQKWHTSKQIVKYVISGGTSALVELSLLYVLTEYFNVWYMVSFLLALIIAFVVSFLMQKFWTFENSTTQELHKQASLYFVVTLTHAGLNISALYIVVEYFGMWYILAQIFIGGILALSSFIIYKFFIFKNNGTQV